MKEIKVGIWGLGRAGNGMHIGEISKYPDLFKIVAGCDIDGSRLEAAKKKIPLAKLYSEPKEFLNDKDVELVSIATRSPDHVNHAIEALKKGKFVFLEKPIALSYAEALKLKKMSSKYPGRLFARHNRRFEPAFVHVREIIASGILGKVYEIKLHRHGYQRRDDWQTIITCGGGQLNNWGPHIIDHALRLLESPVSELWGDLKKIAAVGDAEDHIKIVLKGENGRIIDLEISGGVAISQPEYIVSGSKGALVSEPNNSFRLKYIDPKQNLKEIKASSCNPPLEGGFGNSEPIQWIEETISVSPSSKSDTDIIWKHLFEAIRNEKTFPITIEEALDVVWISEIIKNRTEFKKNKN